MRSIYFSITSHFLIDSLLTLVINCLNEGAQHTTGEINGLGSAAQHDYINAPMNEEASALFLDVEPEDILSIPEKEVRAVMGGRAEFPCDMSPSSKDDSVHMVLWFHHDFAKPVYSLDVRGKRLTSARHWSSSQLFGTRAHFRTVDEPAVLVIENVKESDGGIYRCRVDFRNSPTRNFRFNLTIVVPPSSIEILDSVGMPIKNSVLGPLSEASDVHVRCAVHGGNPRPPEINWYLNKQDLDSFDSASFTSFRLPSKGQVVMSEMKISNLKRYHHGANLTCVANNSNLTTPLSQTVTVSLYLKPLTVEIDKRKRLMIANQRHDIRCTAIGSRPKAIITWWMGSQQLRNSNLLEHSLSSFIAEESVENENVTSSLLSFVPSVKDHLEKLTCRAENPWVPHSFVEDSLPLAVQYSPVVQLKLGSAIKTNEIKQGEDVYFECHVNANPKFKKIQWFHNGKLLQHNVSGGVILSNQSLVLQLVKRTSSGNYTCAVTNAIGTTVSSSVMLTVMYAPICKEDEPELIGVSKGEQVTIICEVVSYPSDNVTFQWDLLSSGATVHVPSSRLSNNGTRSLLHYAPVTPLDYGILYCRARNPIGMQQKPCLFHIVQAEPPSSVHSCQLNNSVIWLQLTCKKGLDGGLPQRFVVEVIQSNEVIYNASSPTPSFHLQTVGESIRIFSVNKKGKSKPVILEHFGAQNTTTRALSTMTSTVSSWSIIIVMSVVGVVLLSLCMGAMITLRVMKSKRRREPKKSSPLKEQSDTDNDKDPDVIPNAGDQKQQETSHKFCESYVSPTAVVLPVMHYTENELTCWSTSGVRSVKGPYEESQTLITQKFMSVPESCV